MECALCGVRTVSTDLERVHSSSRPTLSLSTRTPFLPLYPRGMYNFLLPKQGARTAHMGTVCFVRLWFPVQML